MFATQSLADVQRSTIAPAIIESCASRIFLPNPQAVEPQLKAIYEGFGLNDRQITIVAQAQPKRDYYYQSRLGNRLFDLGLGPVALAFAGTSTPEDQRAIDRVLEAAGAKGFPAAWLSDRGLTWAAELVATAFNFAGEQTMKNRIGALVLTAALLAVPRRPGPSSSSSTRPTSARTRSRLRTRWSRSTIRSSSFSTKRRCWSTKRAI